MSDPTRDRSPQDLEPAAAVVETFLREAGSLTPLGHGQSLAYRVDAPSGRYLLRVHAPLVPPPRPAFFTTRAIESECMWLRALSDETELVVQVPVASPAGYVLSIPGSDGTDVPCTLLSWVEGEHLEGRRTAEQAARLGELVASLHDHAQSWERPAGFERPTHDRTSWHAALALVDGLVKGGVASAAQRALLARAVEIADHELAPLASRSERVGLIHADLHGGNYVVHGDSPRPIDFGLSGFGPWLWDVAECMGHLGPARRRDFVDAYARLRPLDEGDVRRIEGYLLASLVEMFGYNAPDLNEHEFLARAIPAWSPHYESYVEGRPFLFEL